MKIYKGKKAIQGLSVDVIDNLTTPSSVDALSAGKGKELDDVKIDASNILPGSNVTLEKAGKDITINAGDSVKVINGNSSTNPFILDGKEPGLYIFVNDAGTSYTPIIHMRANSSKTANSSTTSSLGGALWITKKWDSTLANSVFLGFYLRTDNQLGIVYNLSTATSGLGMSSSTISLVNTTSAQTIAGIKTFSSRPVCTAAAATDANQLVTKGELDTKLDKTNGTVEGDLTCTNRIINSKINGYFDSENEAINLANSDIFGVNSILFNDESTGNEGLLFAKQGINGSRAASDYEVLRGYRGNLYYDNTPLYKMPIGSVIITSTKDNPSTTYGGTWELTFKKCAEREGSNGFTHDTTQCSASTGTWHLHNNVLSMNISLTTAVEWNDTTANCGTVNLSNIGITRLAHGFYPAGLSDTNNAVGQFYMSSAGVLEVRDATLGRNTVMAIGTTPQVIFSQSLNWNWINDSACDEWHWKRTA